MSQHSPTAPELASAIEFLRSRGRTASPIPGNKANLYKVDGRISTTQDVLRHAIAAGLHSDKSPRRTT